MEGPHLLSTVTSLPLPGGLALLCFGSERKEIAPLRKAGTP